MCGCELGVFLRSLLIYNSGDLTRYETHSMKSAHYLLRLRYAIVTLCMDRKAMVQISVFYLSIYKLTTLRLISSSIGILKLFEAGYPFHNSSL